MSLKRSLHSKRSKKTSENRLDQSTFLKQALKVIGRTGKGWIGVHELTKLMGVTTGSFYWHFKNRNEFVTALLEHWAEEFNYRARSIIEQTGQDPRDQLLKLAKLITHDELSSKDLAMRAWALRENEVAQFLEKVENFRYRFIRSLFEQIGFKGDQLESRTRTFICYFSLETFLQIPLSDKKRKDLVEPLVELLLSR
jgi:AcrR family transcriptional regulator